MRYCLTLGLSKWREYCLFARIILNASLYILFKCADVAGWAHVICALYIPEVRFGDVHSMDPVIVADVPSERFERVCYLCEEAGEEKRAAIGACMNCNRYERRDCSSLVGNY